MNCKVVGYGIVVVAALAMQFLVPSAGSAQGASPEKAGKKTESASTVTPRTPDGHPDLNGVWNGGMGNGVDEDTDTGGNISVILPTRGDGPTIFEQDNTILRRMDSNRPIYKPEFWAKIQHNDQNQPTEDPSYGCMPQGFPRMGPPRKIMQSPNEVVFFYQGPDIWRIIPTDGRAHTPDEDLEGTWMGESIGHWEGDTLVIDTLGFNDTSWLDIAGYFHSENMHAVERLTREGNTIKWQVTVEDPEVLLKPWVMNPRVLKLNADPKAILPEALPCAEHDLAHLVTKEHH